MYFMYIIYSFQRFWCLWLTTQNTCAVSPICLSSATVSHLLRPKKTSPRTLKLTSIYLEQSSGLSLGPDNTMFLLCPSKPYSHHATRLSNSKRITSDLTLARVFLTVLQAALSPEELNNCFTWQTSLIYCFNSNRLIRATRSVLNTYYSQFSMLFRGYVA